MKSINEVIMAVSIFTILLTACQSADFEKLNGIEKEKSQKEYEELLEEKKEEQYFVERQNLRPIVLNVTEPEVKKVEMNGEHQILKGKEALIESRKNSLVQAEYEDGHLKGWIYREDSLYEIQTQTFHSTFIELEPGEQMLEEPYISEPDVWRRSRGVSYKNGKVCQHLVIKPDFANLDSTLIIVTDRRVYHLEIRSYRDRYMPIVRWIYPETMQDSESWTHWMKNKQAETEMVEAKTNEKYISNDYKMSWSVFRKPYWLPKKVYDDGAKTYIVLEEQVLHTKMPALFDMRKNIINYRVQKNILIVDQLITKMTLKIGSEKVTIKKKKVSKSKAEKILNETETEKSVQETPEVESAKTKVLVQSINPISRENEERPKSKAEEELLPGSEEAIEKARK